MKTIKKTLSGLLAMIIMSTMLLVPVKAADEVQTLSKTETTVFGNSSFTWNHESIIRDVANAADKTYTKFEGGGATITATKTFYVEEAGEFSLEVYAASYITHSALSQLQFNIDTDSAVTLENSNSTVSELANPCVTGEPWTTKNIKYNTNLLLDAGLHTITFTVPQVSTRDAAYFAFDCARFVPTNEEIAKVNNQETAVFGNSSFVWNHTAQGPSNNAADGTYTKFEGGGATIIATKTFYVEEAGEFELEVYAASSITHSALSDIQFNIDTDSAVALTSANSSVEALANPCLTGEPWDVKNIKYNTNLLLDAGLHTITFTVPQVSNNRTEAYFAFDCARLVPSNTVISSTETTVFGNSSFTWNHTAQGPSNNAADGTYTKFEGAGATITATKTFYVEEAGEFELEVYAASSITHSALSDIQFNIDTDSAIALTNSNSTVEVLANPCLTGEPWDVKNIKYNTNLLLDAGLHTITFTVPQVSNNRTEAYFAFDCAILTPIVKEVISENGGVIEFEKYAASEVVKENKNTSGGKYAYYEWASEVEETILIEAEKAGYYNVTIDATSAKLTSNNMSPMNFKVNGSGYVLTYEADNHTAVFKTDANGQKYPDETFAICEIVLKDAVYLNKGENKIEIIIPKRVGANDAAFAVVDCIKFTTAGDDIEGIKATTNDTTLAVGTVAEVTVTDTDGNNIDNATITSTDDSVVVVGADKKLTAVGVGRTTIVVSARKNDGFPEHTTSFDVCVGNNGVYVTSYENNAGVITPVFVLDGVDSSKVDVFAAVYDAENGKLLAADRQDIVGGTSSLQVGNASGKTVLYIWEKATMKPLYKETLK